MAIEVILQHGWGFDATFWDSWVEQLPCAFAPADCIIQVCDRGYFLNGSQARPFQSNSSPKVVICHSFGMLSLSKNILSSADIIVVLCGFRSFHEENSPKSTLTRRALTRMRKRFESEPHETLKDFYSNCGAQKESTGDLDLELLAADLEILDEDVLDVSILSGKQVLVINAGADAIVSNVASGDLIEKLKIASASITVHSIADASHALPLTEADRCIALVQEYIQLASIGAISQPVLALAK